MKISRNHASLNGQIWLIPWLRQSIQAPGHPQNNGDLAEISRIFALLSFFYNIKMEVYARIDEGSFTQAGKSFARSLVDCLRLVLKQPFAPSARGKVTLFAPILIVSQSVVILETTNRCRRNNFYNFSFMLLYG